MNETVPDTLETPEAYGVALATGVSQVVMNKHDIAMRMGVFRCVFITVWCVSTATADAMGTRLHGSALVH
jgi:hypothetical protein